MGNAVLQAAALERRPLVAERAIESTRAGAIPWYVWCLAAAVTSSAFGAYWDISWHISIGRDSFWTPAHMAIYLGGVLAGVASGYTILTSTFGSSAESRATSVSVWGFRGPLGCFLAAWGGIAMLTSAPFDNWWHSAYGLDVKIVSLPHSMLSAGIGMISLGALLLVCAQVNRASGAHRAKLDRMLLYIGAIELVQAALFSLESTPMEFMHNPMFYRSVAEGFPLVLIAVSCVSTSRWPATTMAALYTAAFLAGLWIFPLFPAQPKLGPVYQNITHMVPLWFPVLIIVPAFALDLLRRWMGERWGGIRCALLAGCVFVAALFAAQWPFADFLISPAARNWVFGAMYFSYNDPANLLYNAYQFGDLAKTRGQFVEGMALAVLASIIFCTIGMGLGNWMRKVQR
jgi:hypothetical protein